MADLRQAPPPRYRVVERDRKLVVIDTVAGGPSAAGAASGNPVASWWPRQLQFDGAAELTTLAFYDDKAPRTIRLDPGSAAMIGKVRLVAIVAALVLVLIALTNIWFLLPLAFAFGNRAVRANLRKAVTRWLDRVEREAS